ncbi:MAG: S8/S53 family peptidase [Rhodospirillaceae bacterium]|nr:S8/S53 family peptidase [Rhodospirillaceae bacterium]
MPDREEPDYFVVRLADLGEYPEVEAKVREALLHVDGKALTWLKGHEFVLTRPAQEDLESRHSAAGILNILSGAAPGRMMRTRKAVEVADRIGKLDPTADPTAKPGTADPIHGIPWHFADLGIPEARRIAASAPEAVPLSQILVAHPDTGYTEHPVFGPFGPDGSHPTLRGDLGHNFKEPGGKPLDPFQTGYAGQPGHGTRILSVLAGDSAALKGVAAGVTVVPFRVTNTVVINFFGSRTPLGAALRRAQKAQCGVVNISMGDPCRADHDTGAAVDEAYEAGMIIVAAAGNVTSEVTYPGRHLRTITAGGSTRNKRPWAGGSRGRFVDICAPADEIYRADWEKASDGTYGAVYGQSGDGTSYATAHVSGIACLWLARWGDRIVANYGKTWRRIEAFRWIVTKTATRPSDWNPQTHGAGIINARAVLEHPLPPPGVLRPIADKAADDFH